MDRLLVEESVDPRADSLDVLVCAYACNPFRGSEEAVGWNWVRAIASRHRVTVITAAFHRRDIERALGAGEEWARSVSFVYCRHRPWHYSPIPFWLGIEASILKPLMNWAYRLWLRDAHALARGLLETGSFDLTHQLTYVGYRFPGHLWRLGLPFVWGPLGGLENLPWPLFSALDRGGKIYYAGRNVINSIHRRLLRGPRQALAAAGPGVIAATSSIASELRRWYGVESTVICEVTAPTISHAAPSTRPVGEPIRLAWSGGHLPGKALPLLLDALRRLDGRVRWTLDIYGQGPQTSQWKASAGRLGLGEHCHWHGQLPREDAIAALARAHLFVITSLKELTSTVLLEAMSQAVPVVCPDHCGFSDAVTPDCGVKVPIRSVDAFVAGLAEAIEGLYHDEPRRLRIAHGARRRAGRYTIAEKSRAIDALYARVLAQAPRLGSGRSWTIAISEE